MHIHTLALLSLLLTATATAQLEVVVPNANTNQSGNVDNRWPLAPNTSETVGRYQQVHAASELTALIGRPITSVAFRLDEFDADVPTPGDYANLRVGLSTSNNPPDGLNSDYVSNVGADEITVFDAPYTLPTLTGNTTSNPFDLVVEFTTPFDYTGGDLLFDIEIAYATQAVFFLDAEFTVNDSVSRLFTINGNTGADSNALVVRFASQFTTIGTSYCNPAVPNSTGGPAQILALGDALASANLLTLRASQLPPNQPGYFLASPGQGFVPNPSGSQGNLCLALPIARFASQVAFSSAAGNLILPVDLTSIPMTPPVAVQAGETWNFQCWYRDQNPGSTSNFTDGVSVTFQ